MSPKKAKKGYDPDVINLSPTSIQAWFDNGCPQRWIWERTITPKEPNQFGERGTLVHAMMEGRVNPKKCKDSLAVLFYEKLQGLVAQMQMKILFVEVPHKIALLGGKVVLRRRVDAIAELMDGSLAILDWKTNYSTGWKRIKNTNIAPQRFTLQAPGYLIPPPTDELPEGLAKWPRTVIFCVSPIRGGPEPFRYDYNPFDMENFDAALKIVAHSSEQKLFPKTRGKHCLDCPFNYMCFDVKGWKGLYAKRTFDF